MTRIILHIDMDAFFAAIEQLDHPEYRGKPVVVGADPQTGRGVVSTCSYEARPFGIHSAMPINQAYRRCPQAIFVPPRGRRYREMSMQIMDILRRFSPDIEPLSIDEAFLDISSAHKLCGTPRQCAQQLRQAIFNETRLTASVGVAPNKFIAKIASDLEKPDGLVIVEPENVEDFLHPLDISRLWGVGKKTLPLLHQMGLRTIGDLAAYSREGLISRFGKMGEHLYHLSHGMDDRPVETEHERKSISKEITFNQDVADEDQLIETLKYICNELGRDMRREKVRGRTVSLKIRLADFSTFTRSVTAVTALNDFDRIYQLASELFHKFDRKQSRVRLLGVGLSNLGHEEGQLDLFDAPATDQRTDAVMDKIREEFGENAITRASLIRSSSHSKF